MKPQSVSESSDNEKIEEESLEETKEEVKPSRGRKKANPTAASNVLKRNLSKQAKLKDKKKTVDSPDMYAPIEITPTKEYWEYEKEKTDKSLDFPSESEQSMEEDAAIPPFKKTKKAGTGKRAAAVSTPELVNKSVAEVRDSERSRNTSEEESESENPLEAAVRKVVSYRMTPKQALSHYNLTPKVLFDNLLGETDGDRMSILGKVSLEAEAENQVITYCRENETQLSYKAVISLVKDLKISEGEVEFSLSRLEAYRWWYAFRKKP